MALTEVLFSVNDFKEPKVIKNAEAAATLLTRLLILEPGTIQSHPEMGVGLISNYRYASETEAATLQSHFKSQITKYLPDLQSVNINVQCKEKRFFITAEINGALFGFNYNTDNASVDTKFVLLSNV